MGAFDALLLLRRAHTSHLPLHLDPPLWSGFERRKYGTYMTVKSRFFPNKTVKTRFFSYKKVKNIFFAS